MAKPKFNFSNTTKDNFIRFLYNFHRGKANAIKSRFLAVDLNISRRRLRALTNHLLVERQIPIASTCDAGIFYIETMEEMQQSKAELFSRVRALVERADATERAYNEVYNNKKEKLRLF